MKRINTTLSVMGWLTIGAGFAAVGAGWAGVQSTPVVAVQLAYLASGGFAGLALVIVGAGLLSHDDVRASRAILEELRDRFDDLEHDVGELQATATATRRDRISRTRAS